MSLIHLSLCLIGNPIVLSNMYELNLFQEGSSKALSKVPARFQDWSGFSGRAISRHHPPAPEIQTQHYYCWEHANIIFSPSSSYPKSGKLISSCSYHRADLSPNFSHLTWLWLVMLKPVPTAALRSWGSFNTSLGVQNIWQLDAANDPTIPSSYKEPS